MIFSENLSDCHPEAKPSCHPEAKPKDLQRAGGDPSGLRPQDDSSGLRPQDDNGDLRFALVVSRFNETITSSLREGALGVLHAAGVAKEAITVVHVPGAYEIPLVADRLAASGKFNAVIALGCVIRGETVHFDILCESVGRALLDVSLKRGIPVASGILMAENEKQAADRAGGSKTNRGSEAARAALETAALLQSYGK